MTDAAVINIGKYLPPRRRRSQRQKSQYELYPLPFFNTKAAGGPSTWDVVSTGDYGADCKIGQQIRRRVFIVLRWHLRLVIAVAVYRC